jgi:hypothetical protein
MLDGGEAIGALALCVRNDPISVTVYLDLPRLLIDDRHGYFLQMCMHATHAVLLLKSQHMHALGRLFDEQPSRHTGTCAAILGYAYQSKHNKSRRSAGCHPTSIDSCHCPQNRRISSLQRRQPTYDCN